jgi:hypothetical protein
MPKFAAASLQRPEQVSVLASACGYEVALGGDHLGGEQVVGCQPAAALEPAAAAPQRESGYPGGREPSAGYGQPVLLGGVVELSPREPGLRPDRAR